MPEPKYVGSLKEEIITLDRKIGDFNRKFDQKIDSLSENIHKVEVALEKVGTKLEEFIPRVDRFLDRVVGLEKVTTKLEESVTRHDEFLGRAWHLFAASLLLLLGSIATVGGSIANSIWQAQQHGKQIEKLDRSVTSLDKSVAGLEKEVGKIGGLETSIARLDKSVAGLEKSLEQHGKQLDKLEKSVEKIAGLETSIVRLEVSVARFVGLEKSLADLPALARSMDEFLNERRRELLLAAEVRRLNLPLNKVAMKEDDNKTQLNFEWGLTDRQGVGIEPGRPAPAILRLLNGRDLLAEQAIELGTMSLPRPGFMGVPISTKVEVLGGGKKVRLTMDFQDQAARKRVLEHLVDHGIDVEILVATRPEP